MKQRVVVSVLLVLVGVVIGALIIYVVVLSKDVSVQKNSTKNQPTVNSLDIKTTDNTSSAYKNEQYEFSFYYPHDWRLVRNSDGSESLKPHAQLNCGPNIDGSTEHPVCLDLIMLTVQKNEDKLSLQKYFESMGWVVGRDYENDIKEQMVDNHIFYSVTLMSAYDGSSGRSLWIPLSDGNFFSIQESYLMGDEKGVFDEIVRTLQFTK